MAKKSRKKFSSLRNNEHGNLGRSTRTWPKAWRTTPPCYGKPDAPPRRTKIEARANAIRDKLRETGKSVEAKMLQERAAAFRVKTPTLRDKPDKDLCQSLAYGNPDISKEAERRGLLENKCKEILGE